MDEGWLNTGDLGRLDEQGHLTLCGRAKELIIRGGHNIDPALIENALASHSAVAQVAAVGQPDRHAGELPMAFVTLKPGAQATVTELQAYAARTVPERAAVPVRIEVLPELPLTAVGKIAKPLLRVRSINYVLNQALGEEGLSEVHATARLSLSSGSSLTFMARRVAGRCNGPGWAVSGQSCVARSSRVTTGGSVAPGTDPIDTDVLVVGLGPVAPRSPICWVATASRYLAIDQAFEIFTKPRAIALDNEALRILQLVGVRDGEFSIVGIPQVQYHSPLFGRSRASTARASWTGTRCWSPSISRNSRRCFAANCRTCPPCRCNWAWSSPTSLTMGTA